MVKLHPFACFGIVGVVFFAVVFPVFAQTTEHIDIPIDQFIHFSSDNPNPTANDTRSGIIDGVTHYLLMKPSSIQSYLSLPPGSKPLYYEFITADPLANNGYSGRMGIWYHCADPTTYAFSQIEECLVYNQGPFSLHNTGESNAYADYAPLDAFTHYIGLESQQGNVQLDPTKTFWRFYYEPSSTPQNPTATPLPAQVADVNGDGAVNSTDLSAWTAHYASQTTAGKTDGDFNADTVVDGLDYIIWLNHATP